MHDSVEENLRVGGPSKAQPRRLELRSELPKVVDLAVEDEYEALVPRVHRLRAGIRQIQNRETAVSEADPRSRIGPYALSVRSAVGQLACHPPGTSPQILGARVAPHRNQSRYPAHSSPRLRY